MAKPRDTDDLADATARLVRAVGRRVGADDPDDLRYLNRIEQAVSAAYRDAIDGLRSTGFTDAAIGRALGGVSKQAVAQRWPRPKIGAAA